MNWGLGLGSGSDRQTSMEGTHCQWNVWLVKIHRVKTHSAVWRGTFVNRSDNPTNVLICHFATKIHQKMSSKSPSVRILTKKRNWFHVLHLCLTSLTMTPPPGWQQVRHSLEWLHPGERMSLLMAASYCIHGDLEQQQDSSILYSATVICSARQEHLRSLVHSRWPENSWGISYCEKHTTWSLLQAERGCKHVFSLDVRWS